MQENIENIFNQNTRSIDAKPDLGFFASVFVGVTFAGLRSAASKIKDEIGRDFTLFALNIGQDFANILTDSNKDNLAQIEAYFASNYRKIGADTLGLLYRLISAKMPQNIPFKVTILDGIKQALDKIK